MVHFVKSDLSYIVFLNDLRNGSNANYTLLINLLSYKIFDAYFMYRPASGMLLTSLSLHILLLFDNQVPCEDSQWDP